MSREQVLEGFLCPICKADLKSPEQLSSHFENDHSDDQDVLKSLKGLVGKAKKKILNIDERDLELFKSAVSLRTASVKRDQDFDQQELGCTRTHTDYYKAIRGSRLEHPAAETNKLLIRLDKLLSTDNPNRRQHEQSVVEWLDGTSVKLCPFCVKAFNITRRQHHCRLCGSLMCHPCSCFLSLAVAKSMTGALLPQEQPIQNESEELSLRVCSHCMNLLEARHNLQMTRLNKPIVCELYNELQTLITQTKPSVALYEKMCMSLSHGESTYNIFDAQALKFAIAKQAQKIELVNQKIAALSGTPREVKLYQAVKQATTFYLKEKILNLSPIPTVEEIANIRRSPSRSLLATQEYETDSEVIADSGWSPTVQPSHMSDPQEVDPLIVQMDVIRGYIKEARKALRFEEVALLESNLRELQNEFYQRQQRKEAEQNGSEQSVRNVNRKGNAYNI